MSLIKYTAPFLFDGYRMQQNKTLVVDEKGTIEAIIPTEENGEDVMRMQGILSPGFINCHCHLELSHMKGLIPEGTGLIDFVFSVVSKRHFGEEEIKEAIARGEEEMLRNGIVAVGDICNTALTLSQKKQDNLSYYNFIEVTGFLPELAQTRLTNAVAIYDAFNKLSAISYQLSASATVPHAPYSVSEKLWLLLQPYFQNKTISIHNQETSFEDELFIQGSGDFTRMYNLMKMDTSFFSPSGKSSLQTYFPKLNGAKNVILVHNTFTKEEDVLYAKKEAIANNQNLFFCLCINANQYIERAVPPVEMLLKNEAVIVLGTDSLASNWNLSILDEIKTLQKEFPSLQKEELLRFATSNGAKALGMEDKLGSLEKGKQPGILLLNDELSEVKRLI